MTALHAIYGLGPPNQKSWLRLWLQCLLTTGYIVSSDVMGQFSVRLFFVLELVLVMIRVGAKFGF